MLDVFLLAARQLLLLLILGLIGFGLRKASVIRDSDQSCFSWLVMKVTLPCMILYSFQNNTQSGLGRNLLPLLALFAGLVVVSLGIGGVVGRCTGTPRFRMGPLLFGYMFTNAGNLGLVIFSAIFSGPILIYTAMVMFVANLLHATLGTGLMNHYGAAGEKKPLWKTILTTPPAVAGLLGCLLMLCRIQLPGIALELLDMLQSMTAPLAMILVGATLADARPREYLRDGSLYIFSLFRLILLPLLVFALCRLLPVDREVAATLLLITAMPCAMNISVYAEQCHSDTRYASQLVFMSTLLSIFTIPFFVLLAEYL